MTEKLYYKDAYIDEFCAEVISCESTEGGYLVVLDRTAFFPEEGGQYSDTGMISGTPVSAVAIRDGIIYHKTEAPLRVGATVTGNVFFPERFEKMQCHTAEHILSGLFHKYHGLDNVGFHLGAVDVTMDISAPLSWEELMKIEAKANEVVYKNVEITEIYPTPEELSGLEYRSKLDLTENVRIVVIGKYDSCACCAPHVKRTGEIGSIKILDAEKLRGGMRIHIAAGRRAQRVYTEMYNNLAKISRTISVPRLETADAVVKLACELEARRAEIKALGERIYEREGELVEKTNGNLVLFYEGATQDQLRSLANKAVEKVSGILVLLSGKECDYKYVIASQSVNLREEIKKINAALCGRGGGSSVMVQGSFSTTKSEIEGYFI